MGQMRFVTPRRERLLERAVERAYLAGIDEIPFRSRNSLQDQTIVLARSESDSAHLTILWPVDGYGQVALRTASLIERVRPYLLPLELARGTLSRLRDRAFEGQMTGLTVPDGFAETLREATRHFFQAATSQVTPPQAAEAAERALSLALPAMDRLAEGFTEQGLAQRHQRETRFPTLLGARLDGPLLNEPQSAAFQQAFNAVSIATCWRTVEAQDNRWDWQDIDDQLAWGGRHGLRICAGPLLELDASQLPDWLYLWSDDFATLHDYVRRYIRETVERYRDRVHVWLGVARLNGRCPLNLSEEQKLRLAVSVIEVIRQHDPHKPLILSFDQPWAEYLARDDNQLSSLHFADALVRAELGVAGLGLELHLDYADGPLPRDILQIESRIQRWSALGLPLLVLLTAPSASANDPLARRQPRIQGAATPRGHTEATQSDFARRLLPLLITLPAVQGVIWNETRDAIPHEFAHGGVFDASGRRKPVVETITAIRRDHVV